MSRVVICGEDGLLELSYQYLISDTVHQVVALALPPGRPSDGRLPGLPVVPFEELPVHHPPGSVSLLVVGRDNDARASRFDQARALGYDFVSYISSRASVSPDAQVGDNCTILEGAVIQPFVRLGDDVIVWCGSHVGHESVIGDHCFLAAHTCVSGRVVIGEHCLLEANSTIRDQISLAPHSRIGAGATIVKSTKESDVYAGPAPELLAVTSDRLPSV